MKVRNVIMIMLALVLGVAPAHAQEPESQLVDRILAVVEDDAIFQSDVDLLVKQFMMMRGVTDISDTDRKTLEGQALDELVNSRLIVAKANKLGIDVSFADVEQRVNSAIEENKTRLGGEAEFNKALEAEGMTLDRLKETYREQIRNSMLVERVQQSEIDRSTLQVTDAELRKAFEDRRSTLPMRPDVVRLKTVFVAMESSKNAQENAKKKIEELRSRIAAGEDFADIAKEYSEDPSSKNGGALGWVNLDDLSDRNFAEAARSLDVGEVSEPVLTSFGYHLIKVTGVDEAAGTVALSHILVRVTPGDDDIKDVFAKANRIHEMLVGGAPFDSIAAEYSDDAVSAERGGDLGWLVVNDLPEFFRDVLSTMSVGDISQVLREPNGFRIVQLIDREASRPYHFEEVKDQLRDVVRQEKLSGTLDDYVMGLRKEFYVDVRVQ
jgi:peptidyl-prolyl cis-trans isomerase SurA